MKKYINIIKLIAIAILIIQPAGTVFSQDFSQEEAHEYVEITNPSLRKIPMAIPLFKIIPGGYEGLSATGADIMSRTLEFTGYFKMLDRNTFRVNPQQMDITCSNSDFQEWKNVGAELLITSGISTKENNMIEAEFRLFDTFKNQVLVGKKYKGWTKDLQKIIRRFCSEVIFALTGEKGFFDTRIAFVSTGTGNKEIWLCDFDGQNPQQFTGDRSIALFPAWSFDGKWLAYTSYARRNPDIYIRNIADKSSSVISQDGINITPAWVPGKFMLAATLSFSGDQEIYLLSGQGRITRRLTQNRGIDVSPTWSPDGRKIAFVSDRAGSPQLYIKDIGSGAESRLTFQGKYNTQPSWSPRGDKIAYSSMEGSGINIFVIGVNGGGIARLTNSGKNESPSWSPDGSMIAFSSTREGASRIYVMTADGSDQRRLLTLSGNQTSPQWSPREE